MAIQARRYQQNPILAPNEEVSWEAQATFNGSVIKEGNDYHLVYRAISNSLRYFNRDLELSSIGHAVSQDGILFEKRRQLVTPEYQWEQFGCEDPRVTKVDDQFFIFYTALADYPHTPEGIRIGLATTKDYKKIEKKYLVTHFNSKAAALFPEKINGKLAMVLTVGTDQPPTRIALAFFEKQNQIWSLDYWQEWLANLSQNAIIFQRRPEDHIEVGAAPIKTKDGWLLVYSYIKNYFSPPAAFGIEAILLDYHNPLKIIGHTEKPLLIPKEEYEIYGKVPNVIFPTGALIEDKILNIYYGAADTTLCLAQLEINDLLKEINPHRQKKKRIRPTEKVVLNRFPENPILKPISEHPWESKYVYNTAAIYENKKVHLIYRAIGEDQTSVFGYASSFDGYHFNERLPNPIYTPKKEFEKKVTLGFSGCEDPRITKLGDRFYLCYTAFTGKDPTRIALTSIKVDDFLKKNWQWEKAKVISFPDRSDKNACLFSQKTNNQFVFLHRIGGCIWIDYVDNLDFPEGEWLGGKIMFCPEPREWESQKVGITGPPHLTKEGWLLIYHGLSVEDKKYRLGAMLLDLNQPERILSKLDYPLLEPEEDYEIKGQRPYTVFSCGSVIIGKKLFVYYGAADQVIGVATVSLKKLIKAFYRTA